MVLALLRNLPAGSIETIADEQNQPPLKKAHLVKHLQCQKKYFQQNKEIQ